MTDSSDLIHILEDKSKLANQWGKWTNEELMALYFNDDEIRKNRLKTRVDSLYVRILIKQEIIHKLGLDEQWVKEMRFDRTNSGKPLLKLSDKLRQILDRKGFERIELSMSHSRTHLAAIIALIAK